VGTELVKVESAPSLAPVKQPFGDASPKVNRLIDGIRSMEKWYAAEFERRIAGLTELLNGQITEELRSQFSSELEVRSDGIRKQYEERLYAQTSQWQSQRESLDKEIEELRRRTSRVLEEIATTEAAIKRSTNKGSLEMQGQTLDAASLSKQLQSGVEELEQKAYLRGLKFRAT
jgi:chromosome segregation ATPase